jgi:hypothetical protein
MVDKREAGRASWGASGRDDFSSRSWKRNIVCSFAPSKRWNTLSEQLDAGRYLGLRTREVADEVVVDRGGIGSSGQRKVGDGVLRAMKTPAAAT